MAFCSKCGTQLSDGDNFCPRCGSPTDISNVPDEVKEELKKESQPIIIWDEKKDSSLSKYLVWLFLVLLMGGGLIGYNIYINLAETTVTTSVEETNPERSDTGDIQLIREWYDFVLGKKYTKDGVIDKYLSTSAIDKISKDDDGSNIGVWRYWLFRTAHQKTKDKGDNVVESITSDGGGWYEVKYLDMGWNGVTKVRVSGGQIVDFKRDNSWDLYYKDGGDSYKIDNNANMKENELESTAKKPNVSEQSKSAESINQQDLNSEVMKRVNEIKQIMADINKVYNRFLMYGGTNQVMGVNASADITELRLEGDMVFRELISLARKAGKPDIVNSFQQEKILFDDKAQRMTSTITNIIYN